LGKIDYSKHCGVARNFDWGGPKMEKSCDVSLLTFFNGSIGLGTHLFVKVL